MIVVFSDQIHLLFLDGITVAQMEIFSSSICEPFSLFIHSALFLLDRFAVMTHNISYITSIQVKYYFLLL